MKLQQALHDSFKPETAQADPARTIAACQLLVTAADAQPSLLGAMLFPTKLRINGGRTNGGQRSSDGRTSQDAQGSDTAGTLVLATQQGKQEGGQGAAQAGQWKEDAFSALDGLWELLQKIDSLRTFQPRLLAAVLRALVALWQVWASSAGRLFKSDFST